MVPNDPLHVRTDHCRNDHFRNPRKKALIMLKDHKFWAGVVVGAVLYFVWTNYAKKKAGGM